MNDKDSALVERFRTRTQSPISKLLRPQVIEVDSAAGRAVVAFDANPEFRNLMGGIQGGMICAYFDMLLAYAALAHTEFEKSFPTIELKTNFIAPVPAARLIGEARVTHLGRSIAFLAGELRDTDGKLLATATATSTIRKAVSGG